MSGWAGLGRRVARLEAAALLEEAVRVATESGLDPADVIAEAEAIVERYRQRGARTLREVAAILAADEGLDPEEVLADAERWGWTERAADGGTR